MPALFTQHIDRADIRFDLFDSLGAGFERRHVPFVNRDMRLVLELVRRLVVACVARRDLVAAALSALLIAAPMPRVPPVTNATRAITGPPSHRPDILEYKVFKPISANCKAKTVTAKKHNEKCRREAGH